MKTSINVHDIRENAFTQFEKRWALLTAAKPDGSVNTMTVSWGGLGILWAKPMAMIVVRPQRYTLEFIESADVFTLSFFPESYRPALSLCGAKSGRDTDKIKEASLTPVTGDSGEVYFEEADLVYVCKKSFRHAITPDELLLPDTAASIYPKEDYHVIYFGEITGCLTES